MEQPPLSPQWMDISVPLRPGMAVWPGNPGLEMERVSSIEQGDNANISRLKMGAHTGTHMDGPVHFIPDAPGIDRLPLSVAIGVARIIALTDTAVITPDDLQDQGIESGERILFRTRNSDTDWVRKPFTRDFVYLSTDAAAYLAGLGISLIGIDYLSIAGYQTNEREVHEMLLESGIWVVEGLYMPEVVSGLYDLVCLPLRIVGGDGAPARVVIRPKT